VARIVARELAEDGVVIDQQRGEATLTGVAGLPTFNRGVADHHISSSMDGPCATNC
jgi:DNA mismatch repair protein MutL